MEHQNALPSPTTMLTRNLLLAVVLLVGVGGTVSYSRLSKQVSPLSPSEEKRTQCEVHKTALQTDTVPIIYGDVGFPDGYLKARANEFPNATSAVLGGCVISDDSPKEQTVKFCPQCRQAEERWNQNHKRPANYKE